MLQGGMFPGRSETFLPPNQLRAMLQLISLSTFGLFILFISPRAGIAWGKAKRFGAGNIERFGTGQLPFQQFPSSWSSI